MKILIAPNYFKGSLSALKAAEIIDAAIKSVDENVNTIKCPLADGGDGTIDAVHKIKDGEIICTEVLDPLCRKIKSEWLKLENSTALIESARANGLSLLKPEEYNPFIATTYGIGELIESAINSGCNKLIVGVGGSATNDAGYGALKALGVKFLDIDMQEIGNNIRDFQNLYKIDISGLSAGLSKVEMIVATDVNNPLTGKNGASCIYAAQKGANIDELEILDKLLSIFADVCARTLNIDKRNMAGTGAAGGFAYGLCEVLNARIVSGFDIVADLIGLETKIKESDIIITGEGRLDSQTLYGKAPFRVAELAKKYNKVCIAIAGSIEDKVDFSDYFSSVYSVSGGNITTRQAIEAASTLLFDLVKNNYTNILTK